MLPFSREVEHLHKLRHSLAIYRMVFGQSRQEDLISYLLTEIPTQKYRERTPGGYDTVCFHIGMICIPVLHPSASGALR